MEINKIYHLDNREGMGQLPEKCANLIISDPPYFEVKGDFDFVWKSFDEYLGFMEEQAQAYKRILADNGTLFVYGHAKRIAYTQIIFDRYFTLENNAIWHKYDAQTNKGIEEYNCFAPVTERLLMYSNGNVIGQWIRCSRKSKGLSQNEVDIYCGNVEKRDSLVGSRLIQRWEEGSAIPTREDFVKISTLFSEITSYDSLTRCFNNIHKLTDVLRFSQESHITRKYHHETKKPETLTRALIQTCSRTNDLVVVPFAGSGTECAMAAKEDRRFVGFDTEEKYVNMANNRINALKQQPTLFNSGYGAF